MLDSSNLLLTLSTELALELINMDEFGKGIGRMAIRMEMAEISMVIPACTISEHIKQAAMLKELSTTKTDQSFKHTTTSSEYW